MSFLLPHIRCRLGSFPWKSKGMGQIYYGCQHRLQIDACLILCICIWYIICFDDLIWYVWYYMMWYVMAWYDMMWYEMAWYDIIWYDMICAVYYDVFLYIHDINIYNMCIYIYIYRMIWFDMIWFDLICYIFIYILYYFAMIWYDLIWYMICFDIYIYTFKYVLYKVIKTLLTLGAST